jgi:hypothetical protein
MTERIEFEEVVVTDPVTKSKSDAVAVIRNGRQVALLPEADRLRRALNLPLEEVEYIVDSFVKIMGRQPTRDESEFWKAVLDFKRSQKGLKQTK